MDIETAMNQVSSQKNAVGVRRPYTDKKNRNKTKIVTVYKSNGCGSRIIDAVSGIETRHTVGSAAEHLYFKILYVGNVVFGELSEPLCMFFNSPEEYEFHLLETLSLETKTNWLTTYLRINGAPEQPKSLITDNVVDEFVII